MRNIFSLAIAGVLCTVAALSQTPKILSPNGGQTFRPGSTQDVTWDTTGVPFNTRWKFQFGTSAVGPWTDLAGATNVKDSGSTRGRTQWRVPAVGTTTGYLRMSLVSDDNVFDLSDNPFTIISPQVIQVDSTLRGDINGTITLSRNKIYGLDGYVFVNGTLIIEPGTIVVGDTVGQNSVLCVNRGGKLIADGTRNRPIIFTSRAAPGQRAAGDWGGIVLCGRARTNHPGGQAAIEGGIADATPGGKGWFGGTDDDDNSGILRYCRIEFAGIAVLPNNELNSLTMGGVGRGTTLDYIQVSYGNDDAYEWFGGTVNAKHLVAFGSLDDDFDTDNGYRGKVQFALVKRLQRVADVSTSQAFECDNDASASFNQPLSQPIFCNVTAIGPVQDTSWTPGNGPNNYNSRYGASAQIRRNSRASIFNSVFVGWPRGLEIAQTPTMNAAYTDSLAVRACNWYGFKTTWLNLAGGTPPAGMDASWIAKTAYANVGDASDPANAFITNPWPENQDFNPLPQATAPYLTTARWDVGGPLYQITDPFFEQVPYRGAFSNNVNERWDLGWTEYDPINAEYRAAVDIVVKTPGAAAGEKYTRGTSVNVTWEPLAGQNIRIEYGNAATGPWTLVANNVDGATGTYAWTLPNTPMPSVWVRIALVSDLNQFDVSSHAFEIADVQGPTVKLLSPNGGEKFRVGQTITVRWDTTNTLSQRWRIEYGPTQTGPWKVMLPNVKDSASTRGSALIVFRPEDKSTTGHIRLVLLSDETKFDLNDNPFEVTAPLPTRCDSVLRGEIAQDVHLQAEKIYCLDGYVYVMDGATLAIDPGTKILGDTVGQNSVLCINRGAKIIAEGTRQNPIVFTSSALPGQRAAGDWGGIVLCGKARTNHPGGQAAIEGGIADPTPGGKGWFGGTDDNDNSGILRYCRIEFAGIAVIPNSELNSLTMGGVGRGTTIDHIQVSYANDDAYEWFGGTVDAKYLIATGTLDDDFDADNGYSGRVQFGIVQRWRQVADQSTSQAFEIDNDASASYNTPRTSVVFSNITAIGPLQDTSWTVGNGPNQYSSRYGAGAQIRRAALAKIHNSVFMGWPRGLEIAQVATMNAALGDSVQVRNTAYYGIKGSVMNLAGGTAPAGLDATWIEKAAFGNVIDKSSPNLAQLQNPFATTPEFNPALKSGSPLATGAAFEGATADSWFDRVDFRGAVGMERWDLGWTEYDPVNKEYLPVTVQEEGGVVMRGITGKAFPNPTSERTTVRYELNQADVITVEVRDVTGALASTFVSGVQQGEGIFEFQLVTADLVPGVYYVNIFGHKGSVTIPITVMR